MSGVAARILGLVETLLIVAAYGVAAYVAYYIRTHAITTYGRVIHEFDPWFNYRATEYLQRNGISKFFKWFDHESWYPLGRPVGTTIYPGLQFTSVAIWQILRWKGWRTVFGLKLKMSLNDICVYVPCWFGGVASVVTGLLAAEVSGSARTGAVGALIMSVIPAHLMRSIGGGYDNESLAMFTMTLTFLCWTRALRTRASWPIGLLAGLAYGYMVAAWGGFIFVCNMVSLHAAALIVMGYYSPSLHKAYSLWYIVGTLLAVQVPVVGWSPFVSVEQLSALGVFLVLQSFAVADFIAARQGVDVESDKKEHRDKLWAVRMYVFQVAGAVGAIVFGILAQRGFFGPLSIRVRSLFIKHTKTGNPLVDSVAEHQPASAEAYKHYLRDMLYLVPPGLLILVLSGARDEKRSNFGVPVVKWFLLLQTLVTFYFANKMMRLIIFLAPVASCLGGLALDFGLSWTLQQVIDLHEFLPAELGLKSLLGKQDTNAQAHAEEEPAVAVAAEPAPATPAAAFTPIKPGSKAAKEAKAAASQKDARASRGPLTEVDRVLRMYMPVFLADGFSPVVAQFVALYTSTFGKLLRLAVGGAIAFVVITRGPEFYNFADMYARQISNPSIMFKAKLNNGEEVMINDYQEAYWWLKRETPTDARVLAWWDYGYQINGIGNRTSLADGNTWNLEHIALVGRCLALPEKRAHKLIKHLADYVLVWAGNQGDDLAKSPHIARISNSVYGDVCPNDPLCKTFGFYQGSKGQHEPTPSMAASLLYKLHSSGLKPGVTADPTLWKEVHVSKYGLVRIWKVLGVSEESRAWAANASNWKCDAPGSWYCPGQYPPALNDKPPTTHKNLKYEDH